MATKRKGYMTLAEHHAQLKAQGKWDEYVRRKAERNVALHEREADYARAESPIVEELRAAGVVVNSVWDLVNDRKVLSQSLPILLAHLQRPYPDAVRDGLARALAVPAAKAAWPTILKLYLSEPESRTKQGLAVALSNMADDQMLDHIVALARDPSHGDSRVLLLEGISRSRLPQAQAALAELRSDPLLRDEILALAERQGGRK